MANLPMVPSGQDISEMKRLRSIMDGTNRVPSVRDDVIRGQNSGGNQGRPNAPRQRLIEAPAIPVGGIAGPQEVDAMRKILERFYQAAGDTAEMLAEEATFDVDVREAIQTKPTKTGAIIGKWEVKTTLEESSTGKTRKLYTVMNPSTNMIFS